GYRLPLTGAHDLFRLFFFQAEDGIRDRNVTGVQTCALPISHGVDRLQGLPLGPGADGQHGDDRAGAEDDPQRREHRAQPVAAQALDARAEGFADIDHRAASVGGPAAPAPAGDAALRDGSRSAMRSPERSPSS